MPMTNLGVATAVDFRYLLLEDYKKLGLSEEELVVALMVDHLSNQGNEFVTSDFIALKTNFKTAEIDKVLASMVKKDLLSFDIVDGKMKTSLEPLRRKLYKQLEIDLAKDRTNLVSAERSAILSELFAYFEKRLNRTLSPLENQMIGSWLDDSYSEDDIKGALEVCLSQKKRSFKAIDKTLRLGRVKDDYSKEGYSAVNDNWDKNIDKTLEEAKKKWLDDEN